VGGDERGPCGERLGSDEGDDVGDKVVVMSKESSSSRKLQGGRDGRVGCRNLLMNYIPDFESVFLWRGG